MTLGPRKTIEEKYYSKKTKKLVSECLEKPCSGFVHKLNPFYLLCEGPRPKTGSLNRHFVDL